MEKRLLPVNVLLGLCDRGGLDPGLLAEGGFRAVALEVPVGVGTDRVVVDIVLLHEPSSLLIACECKSGQNIEERQAHKYAALDPVALVQAASVDLSGATPPTVSVLYVCVEESTDRIRQGLSVLDLRVPVLGVGRTSLRLHDREYGPAVLDQAVPVGVVDRPCGVPRLIPCDDQSPVDVIRPQVEAVLISHLSRRTEQLASVVVAHETLHSLPNYGQAARQSFRRRVEECLRLIAAAHPQTYAYAGPTGSRDAQVRFLRTPEDNDPRGRTQGYQALARGGHTRKGRSAAADPDQLDLLAQLGQSDEDSEQQSEGEIT